MPSQSLSLPEKPSNVNAIGMMNIVSGIINLLASVALGILFFGLACLPLTLAPAILGVFELLYGLKLRSNPPKPAKPSKAIAIAQIATFLYLNVVAGVIGILSLTLYTDPEVQAYFEALNAGKR